MNNNLNPLNERAEELLSLLVTTGFSSDEQRDFDQIDWNALDTSAQTEIARFEQAAAAFAVAFDESIEMDVDPIPTDLQQRLADEAAAFFGATQTDSSGDDLELIQPAVLPTSSVAPPSWREGLALLAAAACIAMLLFNWNLGQGKASSFPPGEQMAMLVRSNPADLVIRDWTQVHDKNTSGRVVWSDARQEGYMVFEGLPVNDPKKKQYQLWIFDTDADQAYPVDGGVFDIGSESEVVIPIDARVPVDKAVMFAVTVEHPGGVVVSKRENIPVLAKVE